MDAEDRSSASMHDSGPKPLRNFVEDRVSSSANTYASERLEELILEGLDSGPATEWTESDWASLRTRVTKRLESRQPRD